MHGIRVHVCCVAVASGISRECVRRQSAGMAHPRREIKVEASINKHGNRGFPVRTVRPRDRPSKNRWMWLEVRKMYVSGSKRSTSLQTHIRATSLVKASHGSTYSSRIVSRTACCRLKLWWPHCVQTTPTVRPRSRLIFGSGRHFTQVTKDDATPDR